jgi:hypothetical protein
MPHAPPRGVSNRGIATKLILSYDPYLMTLYVYGALGTRVRGASKVDKWGLLRRIHCVGNRSGRVQKERRGA